MDRNVTIGIIALTLLVWIGWDIYVVTTPEPSDTFSEVIAAASERSKGLAWAMGVVAGHWTWKLPEGSEQRPRALYVALLGFLFLLLVLFLALPAVADTVFLGHTAVAFAVGYPMGRFFWPLQHPETAKIS